MNKKGQEEIVGFVLVVVLVMVILVIFLGISLRNSKTSERKSELIYQFIDSLMEQTTECSVNVGTEFLSMDELIRECYSSDFDCSNGQDACNYLEETVRIIMNNSWKIGSNYPLKGYDFSAIYSYNSSGQQTNNVEIFNILEGNCNGSIIGNSYWIPEFPGSITTTLKLCS